MSPTARGVWITHFAAIGALGCVAHGNRPTPRPTISAADLRARLYAFADDSMEGRAAGRLGNYKGTRYLAGEAEKLGLVPAGDGGSFFQTIPLYMWRFDSTSTVSVDSTMLRWGRDFIPQNWGTYGRYGLALNAPDGFEAVYGGVMGDSAASLTDGDAKGKLVVIVSESDEAFFPWGFADRLPSAAAFAVVVRTLTTVSQYHFERHLAMGTERDGMGKQPVLFVLPAVAQRLFGAPLEKLRAGALGVRQLRGAIRFISDAPAAPARNVVAIWPGRDPLVRGEYVVLGAHNDHIGMSKTAVDHDSIRAYSDQLYRMGATYFDDPVVDSTHRAAIRVNVDSLRRIRPARRDSIFNGADDDGSGSVSLLAIAQAFARAGVYPRRSILFVWHTGEEMGMLGSTYFTDHPTVPRDSIVAELNIDMVGRGDASDLNGGGATYLQLVGSRRLSSELGDLVESVNRSEPVPFAFDYRYDAPGNADHIYCRSDHRSYARYGIPIVFFTTGVHRDYHLQTDEPPYIDYQHMARVDQLVLNVAHRLADLDHRVVVDKPRPDPKAPCVQ